MICITASDIITEQEVTFDPLRLHFMLSKGLDGMNSGRETQIKAKCGPRTKILVAHPWCQLLHNSANGETSIFLLQNFLLHKI